MLVLHTHGFANGLLRLCLVLQPAPRLLSLRTLRCSCPGAPAHPVQALSAAAMPKVVVLRAQACVAEGAVPLRSCHAISWDCARKFAADGPHLYCSSCCPLQALSRSDLQVLFSIMLLRCPLPLCRLCHARSYGPS